jgi:hypothetical protein
MKPDEREPPEMPELDWLDRLIAWILRIPLQSLQDDTK